MRSGFYAFTGSGFCHQDDALDSNLILLRSRFSSF